MPTRALRQNFTVCRWASRTTSSTSATATLVPTATVRLRVVSQSTVKARVGIAASTMPRRPPSAALS